MDINTYDTWNFDLLWLTSRVGLSEAILFNSGTHTGMGRLKWFNVNLG